MADTTSTRTVYCFRVNVTVCGLGTSKHVKIIVTFITLRRVIFLYSIDRYLSEPKEPTSASGLIRNRICIYFSFPEFACQIVLEVLPRLFRSFAKQQRSFIPPASYRKTERATSMHKCIVHMRILQGPISSKIGKFQKRTIILNLQDTPKRYFKDPFLS